MLLTAAENTKYAVASSFAFLIKRKLHKINHVKCKLHKNVIAFDDMT